MNQLNKFLLHDRSARVISVQIDDVWQTAKAHQTDSPPIRQLLGELMAAATLLSANLKFDGSIMLQLQGNGPIKLIVVECRNDLSLRATVKLNDVAMPAKPSDTGLQSLLNADGQGRFSVILNPPRDNPGRQPYQGIVPLDSDSVAEVLQDENRLAGILLQRMPSDGGQTQASAQQLDASFEHARTLCQTIDAQELIEQTSETLLHRLFWETPIVGLESLAVSWRCGCDRTRVADMLRSLGAEEVESILQEQGSIEVTCEFCGTPYGFDRVDATALFKPASVPSTDQLQ
jgi:molecular chaperone Hsp33